MVKWIEYRVQYSSGWTDWEITEVNEKFDPKDYDDMDWLARKEGIVRDDDHYRGIEVREVEPTVEYLMNQNKALYKQIEHLSRKIEFNVDKIEKLEKIHGG